MQKTASRPTTLTTEKNVWVVRDKRLVELCGMDWDDAEVPMRARSRRTVALIGR
jgi:hypothetical protein